MYSQVDKSLQQADEPTRSSVCFFYARTAMDELVRPATGGHKKSTEGASSACGRVLGPPLPGSPQPRSGGGNPVIPTNF